MSAHDILLDIHALEEDLLAFERKYGLRSEAFFAAYMNGEEPQDDSRVLDFSEWASVYRTWLARQAEYRNEVQRRAEEIATFARAEAGTDLDLDEELEQAGLEAVRAERTE
jgi:hypothetical protein